MNLSHESSNSENSSSTDFKLEKPNGENSDPNLKDAKKNLVKPISFDSWDREKKAIHVADLIFAAKEDGDMQFDIC